MPRTSRRVKATTKEVTSAAQEEENEEEEVEETPDTEDVETGTGKGKRKRATTKAKTNASSYASKGKRTSAAAKDKRPAKRPRGMRGALKDLPEMPLDVVYEILSNLAPLDLLNLARTSKGLRTFLMHASAGHIWRAVLASSEPNLPPCPKDMSEPAWVDFVLGKHCQGCFRKIAFERQETEWVPRFRGCYRCLKKEFSTPHPSVEWYNASQHNVQLGPYNFAPYLGPYKVTSGRRDEKGLFYHTRSFQRLKEKYKSFATTEEGNAWAKERIEELKAWMELVPKCKRWEKMYRQRVRAAEERGRKSVILKKLEKHGFGTHKVEVLHESRRFWHSEHIQELLWKDITPQAWSRVEAEVLIKAEYCYRARIAAPNKTAITSRYKLIPEFHKAYVNSRPINDLIPPPADIFLSQEVQALLATTPLSREMQLSDFADVMAKMPEISARWVEEAKKRLVDECQKSMSNLAIWQVPLPIPITDETFLDLAVAMFECTACHRYLSYTQALVHACARTGRSDMHENELNYDLEQFVRCTGAFPWNDEDGKGVVVFDERLARSVWRLLERLGYNPRTTTFAQLDREDPVIECSTCSRSQDDSGHRFMLSWRSALARTPCPFGHTIRKVVNEELAADIRNRMWEQAYRRPENNSDSATTNKLRPYSCTVHKPSGMDIACVHCREEFRVEDASEHLEKVHNIPEPRVEDVVDLLDRNPRSPLWYYHVGDV